MVEANDANFAELERSGDALERKQGEAQTAASLDGPETTHARTRLRMRAWDGEAARYEMRQTKFSHSHPRRKP